MKKILSIFLALCMIVTMIPGNALAVERPIEYNIWVGGVQVTSDNKDNVTGDGISGIITYDPTSSTLTLNGATITNTYEKTWMDSITTAHFGIYADTDNLNIVLVGSNTIIGKSGSGILSGGIYTSKELNLSGGGILNVSGGTGKFSFGIYSSGSLTFAGGEVKAVSLEADTTSSAIVSNGMVTISDGIVNASANAAAGTSYGIMATSGYTITGGTVNATGTQAGILGAVTVTGGTVTVKSDTKALDGTLMTSGYTGCTVTASTNKNGDGAGEYNEASLATYKYIKVEPAAGVSEQFTLATGGAYYFDLSSERSNIGTINGALPDTTLHYVPFTYAGTVNAYSLTSAMATTEEYATANKSDRSLFVGDYNIGTSISWNSLNTANLIFGKTFDTNYTLRSLSVGSSKTGSALGGSDNIGQPNTNEWDQILTKSGSTNNTTGWIKNWNSMLSWGQDTSAAVALSRAYRGGLVQQWDHISSSSVYPNLGFRPALEVLNLEALTSDGLRAVKLQLNGGKLKNNAADINIICAGNNFKAPSGEGLTAPPGKAFAGWKDTSSTTTYAAGITVPNTVTGLTAQWSAPPTVTSVAVPAPKTYTTGENFDFTVNFDKNVTVNIGGIPHLALTVGSVTRYAAYVSGSGTSALLFRYTVQAVDSDGDGISVGSLTLNGGTIRDTAGNNATLTLNSVGSTIGVLVNAPGAGTPQTLSFAESTVTKTVGDPVFTNALTHSVGTGTVTYSSSNASVAAVNRTSGEVAIIGAGTTTITANAAMVLGEYAPGSASFTLIVNKAPITNYTVTFNPNGGTVSETSRSVASGTAIGTLPTPTRSGSYSFDGWYTAASGGTQISASTTVSANVTYYAHWTYTGGGGSGGGGGGGTSPSDNNSILVIVTPPAPDNPNSSTQGEIRVPGTADNRGNITVNVTDKTVTDAFDKALEDARKNGNEQKGITVVLRVNTDNKTGSKVTVNLPKMVQDAIIEKRIVSTIVVVDNPGIRISMDLATVREINQQAKADVNITATRTEDDKLADEAKKAIGTRPVFDLAINYDDGKQVQNFGTGSVSVTIPYTLGANEKARNVQAVYVDSKGKVHWLENSIYDSAEKVLRFSTAHFSTYGVGYRDKAQAERIFGQDRYQTALEISRSYFVDGADTVILTRGDSPADALPAVTLAKKFKAPLLLTPPNSLSEDVLSEIKNLGAKKVIIVGGEGAVSHSVENRLKTKGLQIERLYGATRYETAYAVAKKLAGKSGKAILVNGNQAETTFADALSISTWAGNMSIPILYVDSSANELPKETNKALLEENITETILIGGEGVLPFSLEKLLPNSVRYSGKDRYGTNIAILQALNPLAPKLFIATGADFADALAGAAVAAQVDGCFLLVGQKGLTSEQQEFLRELSHQVNSYQVFGGTAAVPEHILGSIKKLLQI